MDKEPILQLKPEDSYTDVIKHEVNLLLVDPEFGSAKVIGSASYRATKYPGDLDFYEVLQYPLAREDILGRFKYELTKTIGKIRRTKGHFFMELKCGLDHRFKINVGTCDNDVYTMNPDLPGIIREFHHAKLLNDSEFLVLNGIIAQPRRNQKDFEVVKKLFRSHYVLRWNWKEIKRGYKNLPAGGGKYTLQQGINEISPINIEVINTIMGKYSDSSNFFILTWKDAETGKIYTINASQDIIDHFYEAFHENLCQSIETMYYSKLERNMIKLAKRYFSYARVFDKVELANKVLPLLNGDLGLLSQLKSELATVQKVLMMKKPISATIIKKQLEDIRYKTSNVLELDAATLSAINGVIQRSVNLKGVRSDKKIREEMVDLIDEVKHAFEEICNRDGEVYLKKVGLAPPPAELRPAKKVFFGGSVALGREAFWNPYRSSIIGGEVDAPSLWSDE